MFKQELFEQISKCHAILTFEGKDLKSPKFIASTIVSTVNEEKERERRWLYLIIHNAPESTDELAETCKNR